MSKEVPNNWDIVKMHLKNGSGLLPADSTKHYATLDAYVDALIEKVHAVDDIFYMMRYHPVFPRDDGELLLEVLKPVLGDQTSIVPPITDAEANAVAVQLYKRMEDVQLVHPFAPPASVRLGDARIVPMAAVSALALRGKVGERMLDSRVHFSLPAEAVASMAKPLVERARRQGPEPYKQALDALVNPISQMITNDPYFPTDHQFHTVSEPVAIQAAAARIAHILTGSHLAVRVANPFIEKIVAKTCELKGIKPQAMAASPV